MTSPGWGQDVLVPRRQIPHRFSPPADRLRRADVLVGVVAGGAVGDAARSVREEAGRGEAEDLAALLRQGPRHRPDDVQQQSGRLRRLQPALGRAAGLPRRRPLATSRPARSSRSTPIPCASTGPAAAARSMASCGAWSMPTASTSTLRRLADVPRRGGVPAVDRRDRPPRDARDRGGRHPPGRARPRRLGLFQQVAPAHVRRMGQHRMAAGHGRVGQAGPPGDGRSRPPARSL